MVSQKLFLSLCQNRSKSVITFTLIILYKQFMYQKIISTFLALSTALTLNAQSADFASTSFDKPLPAFAKKGGGEAFSQGKVTLGIGYGLPPLGTNYFASYESLGAFSKSSLGPLFVKVGYAVSDGYELGLNVNYSQSSASWETGSVSGTGTKYTATYKYSSWSALIRMNKHFGVGEKLDPYWTTSLGYRNLAFDYTDNDPNFNIDPISIKLPFSFEVGIGARYYFTPNIGIYAEAGITRAPFQFGLVAQF